MKQILLSAKEVSKDYAAGSASTRALSGVTLDVEEGEFLCITGPSGSGKSTLLSILGLLETYDSGRYEIAGIDVRDASRDVRARTRNKHFGFVFQSFNLLPDMNAIDNVSLPLKFRGGLSVESCNAAAKVSLQEVGLADKFSSLPSQLSGGQQQRVAIARALVGTPDVVLADEPTGNLDSTSAGGVMDLICELHSRGKTVIMVTHSSKVANLASRVVTIVDGQLA